MKGKPRAAQNWLPNQVAFGVDTSDPEPANWKPFGDAQLVQAESSKVKAPMPGVKAPQPGQ